MFGNYHKDLARATLKFSCDIPDVPSKFLSCCMQSTLSLGTPRETILTQSMPFLYFAHLMSLVGERNLNFLNTFVNIFPN